jgi:hypothetical protein
MAGRVKLFGGPQARLRCTPAGQALVVQTKPEAHEALLAYAARRAAEPAHTAVVVDIPPDTPPEAFEEIVDEIAASPGVLRLLPARPDFTSTAALGSWLADRCHRTVLAHEGRAVTVAGGGLFIAPDAGTGWLRFEPGQGPFEHSRRFPRPYWECPPLAEARRIGPYAAFEPTPAGAWIHTGGGAEAEYRHLLVSSLLPDARLPRIVVGYPGSPITPLSAVADFWRSAPESLHPALRFSLLGPLDDTSASFGQLLADAVDAPVIVGVGVRSVGVDAAGEPAMHTLLPEGTMVWFPYVRELGYLPARMNGGAAPAPVPIEYRPPIAGLAEREPGVYEYDYDAVLEVTQSGLWMRPSAVPSGSHAIRGAAPEPDRVKVVFDTSTQEIGRRMLRLAHEAIGRLEPGIRAIAALLAPPGSSEMRYLATATPAGGSVDLASDYGMRDAPVTVVPAARIAPAAPDEVAGIADAPDDPSAATRESVRRILGTLDDDPGSRIPDGRRYEGRHVPSTAAPSSAMSATVRDTVRDIEVVPEMFAKTQVLDLPAIFGRVREGDIASPWEHDRVQDGIRDRVPDRVENLVQPTAPAAPVTLVPGPSPESAPVTPVPEPDSVRDWAPDPAPVPAPEPPPARPAPEPERIEYPTFQLVSSPADVSFGEPSAPAAPEPAQPVAQASAAIPDAPAAPAVRPAPSVPAVPSQPTTPSAAPAPSAPAAPVRPTTPAATAAPAPTAAPLPRVPNVSITPVAPVSPSPSAPPEPLASPGIPALTAAPSAAPPVQPAPAAATSVAPGRPAADRPTAVRPTQGGPRVQPIPAQQATAIPPASGIAQERVWLRRNLNKQYDNAASSVSRILSEYPGLRAGAGVGGADVLTDLVAVQLYLESETRSLDDAVRAASVGPHVPLARCVAAGLRRLPSYRGAARLRVNPQEDEWLWYADRKLVTEWSFCPVLTSGETRLPGEVEIRIWSMTARRTALVDPSLPEQAVFLPGTNFKVLRVGDSSADDSADGAGPGGAREILLRELARTEVAEDGTVNAQQALDDMALAALDQAGRQWAATEPSRELTERQAGRFAALPGLIGRQAGAAPKKAAPAPSGTRIQGGRAV